MSGATALVASYPSGHYPLAGCLATPADYTRHGDRAGAIAQGTEDTLIATATTGLWRFVNVGADVSGLRGLLVSGAYS